MNEIETIMKKGVEFTPDEKAVRASEDRAMELLAEYDYNPTYRAVNRIYRENIREKGWLYDLFRRSPFYNGNGQIVLPKQLMLRTINKADILKFFDWAGIEAINREEGKYRDLVMRLQYIAETTKTGIVDEDDEEVVKIICEDYNLKFRPAVGQKWSRVISKIAREIGFDKITNIMTVVIGGEERKKDYGWNYQFALFADAINPQEVEKTFVISVNPIDFWTMSFGNSWASCHTIDKSGKRRKGNSSNYGGCYSGGTESYMLDDSSIITYYVDDDEDEPYEMRDKIKRCVFYVGEDKLIQSRVYPDGRDGGDEGLPKVMREIVQYTFSQLLDTPNLWENKKGTEECTANILSYGVHYRDYECYDDCNVSYLRRINGNLNHKRISVGANPICPCCGEEHESEDWITCLSCREEEICSRCGESIDPDYAVYCPDNNNYYCDQDCANDDDVYYCEDDERWHTIDNCERDEGNGYYYYYTDDGYYCEGDWYHSFDAASDAGYYCEDEGEFRYHAEETEDEYYVNDTDNCDLETLDGYFFYYRHNFNGEYTEDTNEAVNDVDQAEKDGLVWVDALTDKVYSMNTPYYEAESGNRYLSVAGARSAGEAVPLDKVVIMRSVIYPEMGMGGTR